MLYFIAATDWTIIVPIIVAFIGPVFAYLAAARRLSGRVTTSDATLLWTEAGKLRGEYKSELGELRVLVGKLRDRVQDLEDRNEILMLENGQLKEEVARLRKENRTLKARITEIERENRTDHDRST